MSTPEAIVQNAVFEEELIALTSIYNSEVTVAARTPAHTSLEIRWKGKNFSFLLRILPSYPETCPIFLGIDALLFSVDETVKQTIALFEESLREAFTPGQECLFDLLQVFESKMNIFPKDDLLEQEVEQSSQHTQMNPSILVDTGLLESQIDCSVCLEIFLGQDVAILDCKHAFCTDCLTADTEQALYYKSLLRCCGKPVPLNHLQNYCTLTPKSMQSFLQWHEEATSANPLYCHIIKCNKFIPARNRTNEKGYCPECAQHTCVVCRKRWHDGVCIEGKSWRELRDKHCLAQCPRCKILIERIEGCNVMLCKCGQNFCYMCGRRLLGHADRHDCKKANGTV